MPTKIVRRRKAASKTPSPDAPIQVWISGDFRAVELARRLARGGLQLKQDKSRVYLVHADREHPPTAEARRQLFEASGIVESVRLALASKATSVDLEATAGNALQAAGRLIDDVAADLGGAS